MSESDAALLGHTLLALQELEVRVEASEEAFKRESTRFDAEIDQAKQAVERFASESSRKQDTLSVAAQEKLDALAISVEQRLAAVQSKAYELRPAI